MRLNLTPSDSGLKLSTPDHIAKTLHPLWLRERVINTEARDPISEQRLYDHAHFPMDLAVTSAKVSDDNNITVEFSDGYKGILSLNGIRQELGWSDNPEQPPAPTSWTASLETIPGASWHDLDDEEAMISLLDDYFKHGFCVLRDTPTEMDSLKAISRRFGYLRETNFGELFNVETKPSATDLAYTDVALDSHTDNPYRDPVPGIQFLHCLQNEVAGGLSTLVDGMAIAEQLASESKEQADVLEQIDVRFRYVGPSGIFEHYGPIVERDHSGIIRHIRLSSRLDYVPAIEPDILSVFYKARARLYELANDPAYRISFPFKPGVLLMMDNYRLLHGRTAFNGKQGHRHLQGCYIDHDGPRSLYRMLKNGRVTTSVIREN